MAQLLNIIRNFNGSESQMIKASATCTVSRSKDSFYYSAGVTYLNVNVSFTWSGVPVFRGTDILAVANGEFMYYKSTSYLNIYYKDISNSGANSTVKISPTIHDAGNTGLSFKFKTLGNYGLSFARSGSGVVYMTKKADKKEVGVGVKYGHSTITVTSPSVSFPAGVGISFSTTTDMIGPNPLVCYR